MEGDASVAVFVLSVTVKRERDRSELDLLKSVEVARSPDLVCLFEPGCSSEPGTQACQNPHLSQDAHLRLI